MKYIITESQREKVVLNWLNKEFNPKNLDEIGVPMQPDVTMYLKDDYVVMEYNKNSNKFLFDYDMVYSNLFDFFGYNYLESKEILLKWVLSTFNFKREPSIGQFHQL